MTKTRSSGEIILDRRLAPRHRFETKATFEFSGTIWSAATRDLTSAGTFLLADCLPPDSTLIEISLTIEDGLAPIDLTGRVVRQASESDEPAGFAVEFDRIEGEDAERIGAATGRP
jgi:hypothetical protein